MTLCSRAVERSYSAACIAGVDEAGRGPLAGPVVAAACVWPLDEPPLEGIDDSKALTPERREALFALILGNSRVGVGVGVVDHQTIDEINILQATMLAMRTAVENLPPAFVPDLALIDGNRCPQDLRCASEALVKGDARCYSIAAASIVAKVTRDRLMTELHAVHPLYGFDRHMGYPTREHVAALYEHGPIEQHRRSFNPLRTWIVEGRIEGEVPPLSVLEPAPEERDQPQVDVAAGASAAERIAPKKQRRAANVNAAAAVAAAETSAPVKRGRPANVNVAKAAVAAELNAPKTRGRPANVNAAAAAVADECIAPKKRGRPAKVNVAAAEAAAELGADVPSLSSRSSSSELELVAGGLPAGKGLAGSGAGAAPPSASLKGSARAGALKRAVVVVEAAVGGDGGEPVARRTRRSMDATTNGGGE